MRYYEILVATKNKMHSLLTYSSGEALNLYQVIEVPIKKQLCSGLVMKSIAPRALKAELRSKCRPVKIAGPYCLPEKLVKAALELMDKEALSYSDISKLLLSNAPLRKTRLNSQVQVGQGNLPALTAEQKKIYRKLANNLNCPQLLFGINGSGKTRLYAELIRDAAEDNKSSLILVPEIGLSAQVIELLKTYLNLPIYHFHSQLTPAQRKTIWLECCLTTTPVVVIGPRSAEFLPLHNLGLIVLDEAHDNSFKQEFSPAYHCLRLASSLAKYYQARLIYGSATPKVEDYYYFQKANYPIHHLEQLALKEASPPKITILKKDAKVFMPQTIKIIQKTLQKGYQVLVFYNRRGSWRTIECQNCFWQAECSRCHQYLVYHQDKFELHCHLCSKKSKPVSACPKCSTSLSYMTLGIKAVQDTLELKLKQLGQKASIWRFDSDNLRKEALNQRLKQLKEQRDLILLGTQIIAQGLDLQALRTVVIVNADQALNNADYTAQEEYYQLIHQLRGRIGRGHLKKTEIVIQTYRPKFNILQAAAQQDWLSFYEAEIKERAEDGWPPFKHFAKLSFQKSSAVAAKTEALKNYRQLKLDYPDLNFYQPMPALKEKRSGQWRWLIIASHKKRSALLKLAADSRHKPYFINLNPLHLFE